jgi:hypothetical protein
MTQAEAIEVERSTRVRTSLGVVVSLVGVTIGAASATVGFKVTAENRLNYHADSIADHESRLRKLEADVIGGLAEIKADLRTIKERIK